MEGTGSVEEYRAGYPRFTALLAAYDPYVICRRFTRLRSRLLLLKQDRLSVLEARLDEVDQKEKCPLFLGASRCDGNSERESLLSEIESGLADYGGYIRTKTLVLASLLKTLQLITRPILRKNAPDAGSQSRSATRC